jgi:hypothetical protein
MATKDLTLKPDWFGLFLLLILLALLLPSLVPVEFVEALKTAPATEQRIIPLVDRT